MAGGLFSINKDYFYEIGAYDDQMEVWGGENLEMSFRVSTYIIIFEFPLCRTGVSNVSSTDKMANATNHYRYFVHSVMKRDSLHLQVWQCGGTVEIAPCSHVGHLFRKSSPYSFPGGVGDVLYGNLARAAIVWMDDWQEFYFKFNPEAGRQRDKQTVRHRLELRRNLKCHNFEWYLDNVWPQHFFPKDDRFFGQVQTII